MRCRDFGVGHGHGKRATSPNAKHPLSQPGAQLRGCVILRRVRGRTELVSETRPSRR